MMIDDNYKNIVPTDRRTRCSYHDRLIVRVGITI